MAKSHLELVAPTEVNRTVAPNFEPGPDLDGGGGGCRGRDRALLGESGLSLL
jgi:hypothetical protein